MENLGPFVAFQEEIEADVERRQRLNLYFRQEEDGRFRIYISKKPRRWLAIALPAKLVTIKTLQEEQKASYLNEPIVPILSDNPTPDQMALTLFSIFIPEYIPYAQGKTMDLYRFDRKENMRGLPDIRIKFINDLVTITHPYQERLDSR
ncbi:MAG: hypothetical protein Q8P25_03180 [Candidatus Curtissbacteria bacterium]|nr:hypothetical protein [Candidatus Curtissbacteria bacterium]MDZ4209619.1 hypothetical protein [Candidatus Curtissbacteria bacterium]